MNKLLLSFLFLAILISCKKKEEDPREKLINVNLTIVDDKGSPVSGARVYFLNSQSDFESSSFAYAGVNAYDSLISANGKVDFVIEPETSHYLYIIYNDQNRKLMLTNEGYSNIINKLPKSLDVNAEVKLTPANANIAFWSTEANNFPIYVTSDKENFTITGGLPAVPTSVFAPNIALKSVRLPKAKFYATNSDGCVWTDLVAIKKGEFKTYEITKCEKGKVVVYTPLANKKLLPIRLLINDEEAGVVTSTREAFACGSTEENTFNFYRETGSFTYVAYSSDGKCAWSGSFDVTKDGCTTIFLDDCKQ